ncbi:unnamed protein product [Blepharisma stoltei]|uniref:Uncharacterized protein n=1 Tax=Blepharisma stoltei TaxID=1481888 RepID=A0AAU9IZS9_9CILI|nr:unnamed protein product [Blepharisma stoltei]
MNLFYLKRQRKEFDDIPDHKLSKSERSQKLSTTNPFTKQVASHSSIPRNFSKSTDLENRPPPEFSLKKQSKCIFDNYKTQYNSDKEIILSGIQTVEEKSESFDDYLSRISEQETRLEEIRQAKEKLLETLNKYNKDWNLEIAELEKHENELRYAREVEQKSIKLAEESLDSLQRNMEIEKFEASQPEKANEEVCNEIVMLQSKLQELYKFKEIVFAEAQINIQQTNDILALRSTDAAEKAEILHQISNFNG